MKAIVCEMCGSNDLLKDGDVYICQNCGTKYTVEAAKKLMVTIDDSGKLDTYSHLAWAAYNSENWDEAYQYFRKVLEIKPDDYEAVFYKGMCQGYKSTATNCRVGEAVSGFNQARSIMDDFEKELNEGSYLYDLVSMIDDWKQKVYDRYFDVDDWYPSNISIFWDYMGACEKILGYLEPLKPIMLKSNWAGLRTVYGSLYCDACYGMCTNVVQWLDRSQTNATFPGLSASSKKKYLDNYDEMVYEVRKYNPEFKKVTTSSGGFVWGAIDRIDPPTRIGPHNNILRRQNEQMCLSIDRAIDNKVAAWKKEEGLRLKKEKEAEYWKGHKDEKDYYDTLVEDYEKFNNYMKDLERETNSATSTVDQYMEEVDQLNQKIKTGQDRIAKLEKKIFGKTKAEAEIEKTRTGIAEMQNSLNIKLSQLEEAKEKQADSRERFNSIRDKKNSYKDKCDDYLRERGLL